jgi:hypothetical protein
MIYLIGGAPRTGKSILGQRFAAKHQISWITTDLLLELLRVKGETGIKNKWDASLAAIESNAVWFFPYLQRLVGGLTSQAPGYVIEGVDFLPHQVSQLAQKYRLRAVFLGRSQMTLAQFDQYPGKSPGYAKLPKAVRQQMVHDIPQWSAYVQQTAHRFSYPYVDMVNDFELRLDEAEAILEER